MVAVTDVVIIIDEHLRCQQPGREVSLKPDVSVSAYLHISAHVLSCRGGAAFYFMTDTEEQYNEAAKASS